MSSTDIDADALLLQYLGEDFVAGAVSLVFESLLYGAYLVLICFSTLYLSVASRVPRLSSRITDMAASFYFSWRGPKNAHTVALLAVTLLMFAMSSTLLSMDIVNLILTIRGTTIAHLGYSLQDKADMTDDSLIPFFWVENGIFPFEFALGDGVVVWRAWALWKDSNRKALIAPLVLLAGSLGTSVAYVGCTARNGFPHPDANPPGCNDLYLASLCASMATNAAATVLIAWRAWMHRRYLKEMLGASTGKTRVQKVLVLLVESGAIYLAVWISQIYNFFPIAIARGAAYDADLTVTSACNQIVGIYPTLVIVLVSLQRTTWDSPGASRQRHTHTHAHTHTHTGMQFAAAPTPASAVDTSTDTVLSRGGGAGRRDAVHPVSGPFKAQAAGDRESDESGEICGDAAEEEGGKKAGTVV
ncbi:hypothetical protein HETIRDRAFT_458772 [Heterobasidion irregulare TC 32-1]|uniref:Uncharacterized protein n=1 Tax=Heterobasidion irregulare (strain TC 32-1) TaxID=747525 RepID=W4KDS8_HETIT|nr:uncharacterized protein HETIRDRAFT_458772 [Heterobasidion irregulare TC 32-1]ETW83470.1 hypothetical protein HETIRDRAFT_458772 [Heterobasidion irregulare TC 32-1]